MGGAGVEMVGGDIVEGPDGTVYGPYAGLLEHPDAIEAGLLGNAVGLPADDARAVGPVPVDVDASLVGTHQGVHGVVAPIVGTPLQFLVGVAYAGVHDVDGYAFSCALWLVGGVELGRSLVYSVQVPGYGGGGGDGGWFSGVSLYHGVLFQQQHMRVPLKLQIDNFLYIDR